MSQIKLKKLSKFFEILSILFLAFVIFSNILFANEPVDIWKNAQEKQNKQTEEKVIIDSTNKIDLSKINQGDEKQIKISEEGSTNKTDIKLIGLFDPQENDLNLDMWSNTDGETIKSGSEEYNKNRYNPLMTKKSTLEELKKYSYQNFQRTFSLILY